MKKRMTRDLIAEAALKLTLEKGLENVTSEEIAHIAFVAPRTVSNYFSCKEEAVVAAGSTLPNLVAQYAQTSLDEAPFPALRRVVTSFFADRTDEQFEQARQWTRLTETYPMLGSFEMASYGQVERDLRALIAVRTGTQVDHDIYPGLVASAVVSAVRTAVWVWAGSSAPDEKLLELLARAFDQMENGANAARGASPIHNPGTEPQPVQRINSLNEMVRGRPESTPTRADRQAAAAVVAEAVAIAREAQADAAAQAVSVTGEAVAAAAEKAADAAATARMDRASAAADAAADVAGNAARAAAATQLRADASATKLSEAAARAVAIITADTTPGSDREATLRALQVAATAEALAVSAAEDSAAAAAGVASAVTAAASDVAFSVSALDMAIEDEVARVAAALQTTATTIARQVAADTHARATDVALVASGAAAAVGTSGLNGGSTTQRQLATTAQVPDVALATGSPPSSSESAALNDVQPQQARHG